MLFSIYYYWIINIPNWIKSQYTFWNSRYLGSHYQYQMIFLQRHQNNFMTFRTKISPMRVKTRDSLLTLWQCVPFKIKAFHSPLKNESLFFESLKNIRNTISSSGEEKNFLWHRRFLRLKHCSTINRRIFSFSVLSFWNTL